MVNTNLLFGSSAWRIELGEKERGSCFVTFSSHLINDLEVAAGGGSVSYVGEATVWKQPSVGDSLGGHV